MRKKSEESRERTAEAKRTPIGVRPNRDLECISYGVCATISIFTQDVSELFPSPIDVVVAAAAIAACDSWCEDYFDDDVGDSAGRRPTVFFNCEQTVELKTAESFTGRPAAEQTASKPTKAVKQPITATTDCW